MWQQDIVFVRGVSIAIVTRPTLRTVEQFFRIDVRMYRCNKCFIMHSGNVTNWYLRGNVVLTRTSMAVFFLSPWPTFQL